MRSASLALTALLLSGCGTTTATKLDVRPASSTSFELRDERRFDQRITTTSRQSSGETTILGDDGVSPPLPQLFTTWLEKTLSKPLAGKVILLREFSVEIYDPDAVVNEQQYSNAASSTPGAGILGILLGRILVGGIESARMEKTVTVRINGSVGEREFSARESGGFRGRVTEADVNSVIVRTLDAVVVEIDKNGATP